METNTTRRTLFAAVPILAVGAAALASPMKAEPAVPLKWRSFFDTMSLMHPNGAASAMSAYRAGMDLANLFNITLWSGDDRVEPHMPALIFKVGDGYRSFNPQGERV